MFHVFSTTMEGSEDTHDLLQITEKEAETQKIWEQLLCHKVGCL